MQAAKSSQKNITLRVQNALIAGCDMVLVCNSPNEVDKLIRELEWDINLESIKRLELMKLDRKKNKKNNKNYCNFSIEEACSIISNL